MGDVTVDVVSHLTGTVVSVVDAGASVRAGQVVVAVELMKMHHDVVAPVDGVVVEVAVVVGDDVADGQRVATLRPGSVEPGGVDVAPAPGDRADLVRLQARRALTTDAARPEAIARRRQDGSRTARENVADLFDDGSFVEYGGLAIAAQRQRRTLEELQERTPADGLITGVGTVHAAAGTPDPRCAVFAYDATVLAGTQGMVNHDKLDRLLDLVERSPMPLVMFVEGGGGRPGDTDRMGASWLDVTTFRALARLSGRAPMIAIVHGYCFAGNAALAGCADVVIATRTANLGMAGPAMIEGGGLGAVDPAEIGPTDLHAATGVVDIVVADESEAVAVARRLVGLFQGDVVGAPSADQDPLRTAVPEDRRRAYDIRPIVERVLDTDSVVELRPETAPGMLTAFARLDGRPVGVLANVPAHLGGAIDGDAADSAARFMSLCSSRGLPIVALCDTPGFMVGVEAERDAGVRRFGRLFIEGANLAVPLVTVVVRKAYGLGAMAMLGGDLRAPYATLAWPTAELGPMGLEGAVRLGFRRELDAIDDAAERAEREQQLIALAHANADAVNVASFGEIDDVIDPAETRARLIALLAAAGPTAPSGRPVTVW